MNYKWINKSLCTPDGFFLMTAFFSFHLGLSCKRFFLADPKNERKRPDSHESVADAVGMLSQFSTKIICLNYRMNLSLFRSLSRLFVTRNVL